MKAALQTNHRKNCLAHLAYNALCLVARVRSSGFLKLTAVVRKPNSLCPVKQKRALLKSNPPRDSWTEGDEIKTVSTFGEDPTSPNANPETFISEPSHALKNLKSQSTSDSNQTEQTNKNTLSSSPFFRSKRTAVVEIEVVLKFI